MYICRYSVENAYLEEKEDTCNALGEMAENLGPSFLPYFDDLFREINILSEVSIRTCTVCICNYHNSINICLECWHFGSLVPKGHCTNTGKFGVESLCAFTSIFTYVQKRKFGRFC